MRILALLIATLPSLAVGGSLDPVTSELVATVGGFDVNQIVDGERVLKAMEGRSPLINTDRYKPTLLVTSNGPEQVNAVQCTEQKTFFVNADEPEISGTHTEFDVLRITFARCTTGPLAHAQIKTTAEASLIRLKEALGGAPSSPKLDAMLRITTSKVENTAELLQFTVSAFGHGAAFLPTAVIHSPGQDSLAVQIYFADYLQLPADPKADTPVIAPLRRAMEDPASFAALLVRRAYMALKAKAKPRAPARRPSLAIARLGRARERGHWTT